jgi:hypothetical protein
MTDELYSSRSNERHATPFRCMLIVVLTAFPPSANERVQNSSYENIKERF